MFLWLWEFEVKTKSNDGQLAVLRTQTSCRESSCWKSTFSLPPPPCSRHTLTKLSVCQVLKEETISDPLFLILGMGWGEYLG